MFNPGCPECYGTGKYVGLNVIEPCSICSSLNETTDSDDKYHSFTVPNDVLKGGSPIYNFVCIYNDIYVSKIREALYSMVLSYSDLSPGEVPSAHLARGLYKLAQMSQDDGKDNVLFKGRLKDGNVVCRIDFV